ncbi:hypothetical protein Lepto7375DRAFT_2257 [Leptolyngbya sp. PCC 7375]|nr:hypothetical protein Lepto7375DRAFT_2257 [Leptolyngbya sp. PCC 7375]
METKINYVVEGVGFHNKGAQLMLLAIQQELATWNNNNSVSLDFRVGDIQQRNHNHVKHLLRFESDKLPWLDLTLNTVFSTAPNFIRDSLNVVLKSDIDVVLDASGFRFSDQWGLKATRVRRQLFENWKKKDTKIILLPQAFGPFTQPEIQQEFDQILKLADLIFARDQESFNHIQSVSQSLDNVKIAPDFTNLLEPKWPSYASKLIDKPCIIPNARMLDKTDSCVSNKYLDLLIACIDFLQEKGLEPFILIHETFDISIAEKLNTLTKKKIQVIQEEDPLYLKGILGDSKLVIGSRFHGLISSLSQGIPCLGTGWSHKYEMLFDEYNCSELLINVGDEISKVLNKLESLIEGEQREAVVKTIKASSEKQKKLSTEMWDEVQRTLLA